MERSGVQEALGWPGGVARVGVQPMGQKGTPKYVSSRLFSSLLSSHLISSPRLSPPLLSYLLISPPLLIIISFTLSPLSSLLFSSPRCDP